MRATHIAGTNIKGTKFVYELSPFTIFIADNMAGKTAIAEAARLAMIGYIPGLSKRPRDIFDKFGTGTRMSAEMIFEKGKVNKIEYFMARDSVKTSGQNEVEIPPILLDRSAYFELSAKARVNKLFDRLQRMQAEPLTAVPPANALKAAIKSIKLEPASVEAEEHIESLCNDVELLDDERSDSDWTITEFLERVTETIKQKRTEAETTIKQMQASICASVSMQAAEGIPTVRPGIENELKALHDKANLISTRTGELGEQIRQAENSIVHRNNIASSLRETPEIDPETIATKFTEKSAVDTLHTAKVLTLRPDWAAVLASNNKFWQAMNSLQNSNPGEWDLTAAADASVRADAVHTNCMHRVHQLEREREENMARAVPHVCQKCGHEDKSNLESVDKLYSDMIRDAKIESEIVLSNVVKCRKAVNAERDRLEIVKKEIAAEAAKASAAYEASCKECEEINQTRAEIERLAQQSAALDREWKEIVHARELRTQKLLELQRVPDIDRGPLVSAVKSLAEELMGVKARTDALEAEKRKAVEALADQKRRAQAKQEYERRQIEAKVCAESEAKVLEYQERTIKEVVGGFMTQSGEILLAVLGKTLEFNDGDIGFYTKGKWVSHSAMSGIEQTLCYIGLQVAFAQHSPCKMVIIDEMGTFHPSRKPKLVETLLTLIHSGTIDNVIGLDVRDDYSGMALDSLDRKSLRVIEIAAS